jgi:hypothetical protein
MARGLRATSQIARRKGFLERRVDSDARELALRQLGHCNNILPTRY